MSRRRVGARRLGCERLEHRVYLAARLSAFDVVAEMEPAQACQHGPVAISESARQSSATTAMAEYFLSARDSQDQLLSVVDGMVEVGVGIENSFFLEVAYSDLRTFGDDVGAFSVYVDLGLSQPNLLRPVLRETQRIVFGNQIYDATSGSITFAMQGMPQAYIVDLADFAEDPIREIQAALDHFGYLGSQYQVTSVPSDDLLFEIRFVDPAFGNLDLPNFIVTSNLDVSVPTDVEEVSAFMTDGVTPNGDALRFNLDTRSRTFNDNQRFYSLLNRGTYDLTAGFIDVGGTGLVPAASGGIPGLSQNGQFIEPFDVFRIEVFLADYLRSPLVVDVNPSEGVDPLLLFGEDEVVPPDAVVLGTDASVTLVTPNPTVNQVVVNGGANSRSQVTSIAVTFDEALEIAPLQSAFTLVNTTTATPVGMVNVSASVTPFMTVVTLTFDGDSTITRAGTAALGNSLADGNYRLHIESSKIRSTRGFEMRDDEVFGDQAADRLFRLFGDSDGDRDVDGQDYGRFGLAFLSTFGSEGFNAQLDSDGDGDVDGQDYGRFGLNFLRRL
ncbi:hypothetical protein Mal15_51680 [Stieleria maiorica]|uniref:Uncharacterized protein n=1 Tax=Stieleria maiorica TaxID=2795974 RepID=A0A5B9MIM1_9BACT|nr:hypothetical protein [Stieleria maiorica]QEG01092.1 hypothetical protein Mal15_51680 [Stieleria maiorica]